MSLWVLAAVAYRSFARGESRWDLLALVLAGGLVPGACQGAHHVLTRRWALTSAITLVAAALVAALVALASR